MLWDTIPALVLLIRDTGNMDRPHRIHQPEIADDTATNSLEPIAGSVEAAGKGSRRGPCSPRSFSPARADPWLQRKIGVGSVHLCTRAKR